MDESIGFASIKVLLKDGVPIEEPTILHKPPEGMNKSDLNIKAIEKSLRDDLNRLIKTGEVKDGKLGYFIEYSRSEYKIN